MRAFERVFLLSSLSPLTLRFSFLPPPRFSFYFALPLCAFFLFFSLFFFLKRGQTVNSFVSLMHELRSCIAPRLPYTHRPSTSSVSPLFPSPIPFPQSSPPLCIPLKFHIPIRAFAKYSLRFYPLVKFSRALSGEICILRKTEAGRQLR